MYITVNTQATHHGVLQLCVRVRDLAPNRWNIRSTARLVPIEWPDSTVIRLAILPAECAATMSERFESINNDFFSISFHYTQYCL